MLATNEGVSALCFFRHCQTFLLFCWGRRFVVDGGVYGRRFVLLLAFLARQNRRSLADSTCKTHGSDERDRLERRTKQKERENGCTHVTRASNIADLRSVPWNDVNDAAADDDADRTGLGAPKIISNVRFYTRTTSK